MQTKLLNSGEFCFIYNKFSYIIYSMIPSKTEVLNLLTEAKQESAKNCGWAIHSVVVGDTAKKIAEALNQSGQQLNPEEVMLMGYLHDIGKKVGPFVEHPYNGYKFMKDLGYDEKFCNISLVHSFVNNDPFCMFNEFMLPGRDDFVISFIRQHDFTLAEQIIALCDQVVTTKVMTVDKRIVDIISRHGICKHTPERIREVYRLKEFFDDLLSYNLYDLFPEIKDNL